MSTIETTFLCFRELCIQFYDISSVSGLLEGKINPSKKFVFAKKFVFFRYFSFSHLERKHVWLFNAPVHRTRASSRTSNFLTLPYIYFSTSVGNGFRGECIRFASSHVLYLRDTAASYFPSNIAQMHTDAYTLRLITGRQYVSFWSIICIDERFSRRQTQAYGKCSLDIIIMAFL